MTCEQHHKTPRKIASAVSSVEGIPHNNNVQPCDTRHQVQHQKAYNEWQRPEEEHPAAGTKQVCHTHGLLPSHSSGGPQTSALVSAKASHLCRHFGHAHFGIDPAAAIRLHPGCLHVCRNHDARVCGNFFLQHRALRAQPAAGRVGKHAEGMWERKGVGPEREQAGEGLGREGGQEAP
jgi:hypothetical protein